MVFTTHLDARTAIEGVESLTSGFVDVKDFGAAGDYSVSGATGTDDTAAIQAAIDSTAAGGVNAGKQAMLTPGRYMTTAPLVLKQGTSLVAPFELRTSAVGNQGPAFASTIDFHGGPTDNAIQAVGTTEMSVSRALVSGFKVVDRRTSPTGGHGVLFEKVVNQSVIRHMDFNGFPTGASIRLTAQSGQTSDCVEVTDIWSNGSQYVVDADRVDNYLLIRKIHCDSVSGSPLVAAIRLSACDAAVLIEGVKHECTSTTAKGIVVGANAPCVNIRGYAQRADGTGAACVSLDGTSGIGVNVQNLWRKVSGTLMECVNATPTFTITGTRLPAWVPQGLADGLRMGGGHLYVENGALKYRGASGTITTLGAT